MTEDEAKTKWCPMGRVVSVDQMVRESANTAPNRMLVLTGPGDDDFYIEIKNSLCIASECMMWCWASLFSAETEARHTPSSNKENTSKNEGYCGLAGKP